MPNGGIDCCANCGFNKAVQEMPDPYHEQPERFQELSYCTLRDLKISDPFSTHCKSFICRPPFPKPADEIVVEGWVYASGLSDGNVRIPWHGDIEPVVSTPCTCSICGRTTDQGITVVHDGTEVGFCSDGHYYEWWKTQHDDPPITAS